MTDAPPGVRDGRGGRSSSSAAIAATTAASMLAVVPMFLLGSLAPFLQDDLDIGAATVGLMASAFAAGNAAGSLLAGRLVVRLGPARVVFVSGVMTGVVVVAVGSVVDAAVAIVALMVVAGSASGALTPATDLSITVLVPPAGRGLAFGVKQAAVPAGSMVAGLAVPLLGETLGWRAAYLGLGAAALVVVPLASRAVAAAGRPRLVRAGGPAAGDLPRQALVELTIAAGLVSAALGAAGTFLVESATHTGMSTSTAGVVLAGASLCGVVTRVFAGWRAGRRSGRHLHVTGVMMLVGGAGFLGLASGNRAVFIVGAAVIFAGGWGWGGLMRLALAELNPSNPAASSGVLGFGLAAGSTVGPATYGVLFDATSFGLAWTTLAVVCAGSGVLVLSTRARLRSARARSATVVTS